jgi:hypothetical protein
MTTLNKSALSVIRAEALRHDLCVTYDFPTKGLRVSYPDTPEAMARYTDFVDVSRVIQEMSMVNQGD